MSGGRYEYAYERVERVSFEIAMDGGCHTASRPLRNAFRTHLVKVARALKAIEWNDSGDGDKDETELIQACLPGDAELDSARQLAIEAREDLDMAIERSKPGANTTYRRIKIKNHVTE